jgi:hypothetical protein
MKTMKRQFTNAVRFSPLRGVNLDAFAARIRWTNHQGGENFWSGPSMALVGLLSRRRQKALLARAIKEYRAQWGLGVSLKEAKKGLRRACQCWAGQLNHEYYEYKGGGR